MKTINAGKFKDQCLKIMDAVAKTKAPIVVTKRGGRLSKLCRARNLQVLLRVLLEAS